MDPELSKNIKYFFSSEQKDARRLFHGRGQLYPGLEHICIDWFAPTVLITLYDEFSELDELSTFIKQVDPLDQVNSIIVQKRFQRGAPAQYLLGEADGELVVSEGDLRFEVHPGRRQNVGLFLDMRLLRDYLQANCEAKNVLNLFAYTCSLSVAALAGGAKSVCNVDMSKPSILWGERNHLLNGQCKKKIKSIPHNLFKSWGRIKQFGRYDLVIIDPPTRQRGSFDVSRNYPAVIKRLSKLCNPGAEIIATVNSPFLDENFLPELFRTHLPEAQFESLMAVAAEFEDKFPQRGLKIYRFSWPVNYPLLNPVT